MSSSKKEYQEQLKQQAREVARQMQGQSQAKGPAWGSFMDVLFAGLAVLAPIGLLVFIVVRVWMLLNKYLVKYIAKYLLPKQFSSGLPFHLGHVFSTILSLLLVIGIIYLTGALFQRLIQRLADIVLSRIPFLGSIYRAIQSAVTAMKGLSNLDRVVLVKFPHENARMMGYVMNEVTDATTGEPLLWVNIPIAVFPPSGYTLCVPASEVIDTDWGTEGAYQVLLSGGMSVPDKTPFYAPDKTLEASQGEES